MRGEYRCGLAVSCNEVKGIFVEETAGFTEHLPFVHPQLPEPHSRGPSQEAVHRKLQTWIDSWFTQVVG
jgi:hypothetical protein